jgi:hypothetical protein
MALFGTRRMEREVGECGRESREGGLSEKVQEIQDDE